MPPIAGATSALTTTSRCPLHNAEDAHAADLDCAWLAAKFRTLTAALERSAEPVQVPKIWSALATVNTKPDMLANWVALRESRMSSVATHRVELSASGITFVHPADLITDFIVKLRMLLFPEHRLVQLKARVVRAISNEPERFAIALACSDAELRQRGILVAHILRKEFEQLRARRES